MLCERLFEISNVIAGSVGCIGLEELDASLDLYRGGEVGPNIVVFTEISRQHQDVALPVITG